MIKKKEEVCGVFPQGFALSVAFSLSFEVDFAIDFAVEDDEMCYAFMFDIERPIFSSWLAVYLLKPHTLKPSCVYRTLLAAKHMNNRTFKHNFVMLNINPLQTRSAEPWLPFLGGASKHEASSDFETLSAGRYPVVICASEMRQTKSLSGHYLQLQFEVLSGTYAGRRLFAHLNLIHRNAMVVKIAQLDLKAICDALHIQHPIMIPLSFTIALCMCVWPSKMIRVMALQMKLKGIVLRNMLRQPHLQPRPAPMSCPHQRQCASNYPVPDTRDSWHDDLGVFRS